MINKDDYVPEPPKRSAFPTPVIRGFEAYESPVTGKMITSPNERREDLKRNDCIPWEPGINQDCRKRRGDGARNPRTIRTEGNREFREAIKEYK